MITSEGTIEIEMANFWSWVENMHPCTGERVHGVPRVNYENNTIEIDFAESSESCPSEWANRPKCLAQWDELKKLNKEK